MVLYLLGAGLLMPPFYQRYCTADLCNKAATRHPDARLIAEKQLSVLRQFIVQTAEKKDLAEYHQRYFCWEKEMSFLANRNP